MPRPVIGSKFTFFFGNEGSNTVNYRHKRSMDGLTKLCRMNRRLKRKRQKKSFRWRWKSRHPCLLHLERMVSNAFYPLLRAQANSAALQK